MLDLSETLRLVVGAQDSNKEDLTAFMIEKCKSLRDGRPTELAGVLPDRRCLSTNGNYPPVEDARMGTIRLLLRLVGTAVSKDTTIRWELEVLGCDTSQGAGTGRGRSRRRGHNWVDRGEATVLADSALGPATEESHQAGPPGDRSGSQIAVLADGTRGDTHVRPKNCV